MVNVVFLDIDGVLNHQFSKDRDFSQSERFGIAQDLVDNLKLILDAVDNCKIIYKPINCINEHKRHKHHIESK